MRLEDIKDSLKLYEERSKLKFKVGDKVKVVKQNGWYNDYINAVGVIIEISNTLYPYRIEFEKGLDSYKYWWSDDELELYIEPKKEQMQETIIFEYQPYNVTVTSRSSKDNYGKVTVHNIFEDKQTVNVIFNDDTTICILEDGSKGISKCSNRDIYDRKAGQDIAFYRAMINQYENKIEELTK